jgi:hypothetical protein
MITSLRDDPYLECRPGADRHSWDRQPLARRTSFGQPRDFRCVRCGTVKRQIIDANGNLAAQWYDHPKDYQLDFPYTAEDVRLESVRRAKATRRLRRVS